MVNITHSTSGVSAYFRTSTRTIFYINKQKVKIKFERKQKKNKETNKNKKTKTKKHKKKEKENTFIQPQHQTNWILRSWCLDVLYIDLL